MPRYFGTLFFKVGRGGWSETYAISAADYLSGSTILGTIATARLALLVSDVSLIATRISDTDVKGDSSPTGITVPQVGTYAIAPADVTSNFALNLRIQFYGASTQRGQRWVRAIPASQVGAGGEYVPAGTWAAKLTTFANTVQTSSNAAHKIAGAVAPPFYAFTPYSGYTLENFFTQRKIGRPFDLLRGRRQIA
jgi:hypothetical protein